MKLFIVGLLALGSVLSAFADSTENVVCSVKLSSETGIASVKCLPKGFAQTEVLFPSSIILSVLNKGYSASEQKLIAVKEFKDLGIELRSEAVYPNKLENKKDKLTYATELTFSSNKPILLQDMP